MSFVVAENRRAAPSVSAVPVPGEGAAGLALLDATGEGAMLVGPDDGELAVGERFARWDEEVREQVRRACLEALRHGEPGEPSRRVRVSTSDDHHLEVVVSLCQPGGHGRPVVTAVLFDATSSHRLQQKIDAIDKAGSELVRIESQAVEAMTPAERLKLVEDKVIRVTHDLMSFDHFCIRLLDPEHNRLEPVLADGLPTEALDVVLTAEDEANGISGYVARTGRSYICPDVSRDRRYVAGLDGARSSLTVPLTLDDQIVGVLNVESRDLAAFGEDDRQFAEIFGRYVAIALSILRLLVHERAATNKKFADDVVAEVIGPLNDIQLDAQTLLDDFVGHEALRHRLQDILGNVEEIRRGVRDASSGTRAVLGTRGDGHEVRDGDDPLDRARILVADDEAGIRETVAGVLRKHGAAVATRASGGEAIAALEAGFGGSREQPATGYDLVLSDIRMPDKSGYEVFAASRRLSPPPSVVLMTGFGYDPNHCIVRASQEGLDAVLFKPFRVQQMLHEVRTALRLRRERVAQPAA